MKEFGLGTTNSHPEPKESRETNIRDESFVTSESTPTIRYRPVIVHSRIVPIENLEASILDKLSNIGGVIALKGGFARELFRFSLGITKQCNYEKLDDLDIVVFETPSMVRSVRIARRDQIASLSDHFEPKDIEICNSIPEGLLHFFRTRDVTMNELVMFKDGNNLRFLHSEAGFEDLTNRVIRPSIHCTRTGLGPVWYSRDGKRVLAPEVIGRCIYRKVKGDGDVFESDKIDFYDSTKALDVDSLFKIIKRFSQIPQLFEACIQVFGEIGISDEMIDELREKIQDPKVKKSRGTITSEIVENLLDERSEDYQRWLQSADSNQRAVAEVLVNID